MPSYSSRYKTLHDIEWFFECCGYRVHAVSNAGEIPAKIDRDENTRLQFRMEEMPDIIDDEDVYVNSDYVRYRLSITDNNREGAYNDYVYGFKRIARKGYYSFDRDITVGENSRSYVLIAGPGKAEIQQDIQNLELPRLEDGVDIRRCVIGFQDAGQSFLNWGFVVL